MAGRTEAEPQYRGPEMEYVENEDDMDDVEAP